MLLMIDDECDVILMIIVMMVGQLKLASAVHDLSGLTGETRGRSTAGLTGGDV